MGGAAGGARGRGDGLGPPCRARRVADRDLASRARRRGGTGDEGRRRGAMSGARAAAVVGGLPREPPQQAPARADPKVRRLEREAPDATPACAATPDAITARLDEFLVLHRRSRAGKARFMDARMETFFRRVVTRLAERGMARLWFLDATGGPMAAFITLEWDGIVGLYNSGFHPDRAQLAPGLVLLVHLVRDAIQRGMQRFD